MKKKVNLGLMHALAADYDLATTRIVPAMVYRSVCGEARIMCRQATFNPAEVLCSKCLQWFSKHPQEWHRRRAYFRENPAAPPAPRLPSVWRRASDKDIERAAIQWEGKQRLLR